MQNKSIYEPSWITLARRAGWEREAISSAVIARGVSLKDALQIVPDRIEEARKATADCLAEIGFLLQRLPCNHRLWLLHQAVVSGSDANAAIAWEGLQAYLAESAMTLALTEEAHVDACIKEIVQGVYVHLEHWTWQCKKTALQRWEPTEADDYPIHTSQEWRALSFALADGHKGMNYSNDMQALSRIHQRHGEPFSIRLDLLPEERRAGLTELELEGLTSLLNADAVLVLAYVAQCLTPTEILPRNTLAAAWLDLNDIADKIGLDARSAAEREENRRFVWEVLRFASRASIVGERTTIYYDKTTREVIPTRLHTPAFSFVSQQLPLQSLTRDNAEVPLRVQLVASEAWTQLTTTPDTAQYLPCMEILARIPSRQPSGAWSRVIGMALAHFWRRNSRETLAGSRLPTRRELLDMFPATVAHYADVLASKNPRRVLDYWRQALRLLVDVGYIADGGEARAQEAMLPRQGWQDAWLKERMEIRPGAQMQTALQVVAKKQYDPRLRNLQAAETGRKRVTGKSS